MSYSLDAWIWGEKYYIEHIKNKSDKSNGMFCSVMLKHRVPRWVAFTSSRLHIHTEFVYKLYCTFFDLPALPWHYNLTAAFSEWFLWTVLSVLRACAPITFPTAQWGYPHFADKEGKEHRSAAIWSRTNTIRRYIQLWGLPNSISALPHYSNCQKLFIFVRMQF